MSNKLLTKLKCKREVQRRWKQGQGVQKQKVACQHEILFPSVCLMKSPSFFQHFSSQAMQDILNKGIYHRRRCDFA